MMIKIEQDGYYLKITLPDADFDNIPEEMLIGKSNQNVKYLCGNGAEMALLSKVTGTDLATFDYITDWYKLVRDGAMCEND
jgi:hypothetical protein